MFSTVLSGITNLLIKFKQEYILCMLGNRYMRFNIVITSFLSRAISLVYTAVFSTDLNILHKMFEFGALD